MGYWWVLRRGRGKQEGQSDAVGERLDWPLLALKMEEGGYEPGYVDSFQRLEKARKWILF